MGVHPKYAQLRTGLPPVSHPMYMYALTFISFYIFGNIFILLVSYFISRNLTLPIFKQDLFVRNGYFSQTRSIPVVMK